MFIQSDSLALSSTRTYKQTSMSAHSVALVNATPDKVSDDSTKGNKKQFTNLMDMLKQYQSTQDVKTTSLREKTETLHQIRQDMILYFLRMLFENFTGKGELADNNFSSDVAPADAAATTSTSDWMNNGFTMQTTRYSNYFYYEEDETTSFTSTGQVQTADGRSINVDMTLSLSRSFVEATSEYIDYSQPVLCDPLVINIGNASAGISDQKFFFDLDADGNEEEISKLTAGSGFLALDKNGDGIINDGTELFGAQSGNGFAELSVYDEDGNGWIDEADPIFDKLRIWSIDEAGNRTLVGLGKAGVGAIYLGSSDTQFSLNTADNTTNAIIRKTGLFLYENGGSGTIQQLDMAT